jgi:hypothetical protein
MPDVGLGIGDVERVEPLLTFRNDSRARSKASSTTSYRRSS